MAEQRTTNRKHFYRNKKAVGDPSGLKPEYNPRNTNQQSNLKHVDVPGHHELERYATAVFKDKKIGFPYKNLYISREDAMNSFEKLKNFSREFIVSPKSYKDRLTVEKDLNSSVDISFDIRGNFWGDTPQYIHFAKSGVDYETIDWLVDWFIEPSRMQSFRLHQGKKSSPHSEWYGYTDYVGKSVIWALRKLDIPITKTSIDIFADKCLKYDKISLHTLREGLYSQKNVPECANESPCFLKMLFKMLVPDVSHCKIFDAAAGWGDKLLAAMSLGCERYVGIDPNLNSQVGFHEMVTMFGVNTTTPSSPVDFHRYSVLPLAMPDCGIPAEPGTFDIGFISPPSYNSEVYSNDAGQSINMFSDKTLWLNKFLIPTINKTIEMIKPNGFLIIQSILIGEFFEYISGCLNVSNKQSTKNAFGNDYTMLFVGPIAVTDSSSFRYKPMWIWKKISFNVRISRSVKVESYSTLFYLKNPRNVMIPDIPEKLLFQEALTLFNENESGLRLLSNGFMSWWEIPPEYKIQLLKLRMNVWKNTTFVKEPYDRDYRVWEEPEDNMAIHLVVMDKNMVIAATRISLKSSIGGLSSAMWLLKQPQTQHVPRTSGGTSGYTERGHNTQYSSNLNRFNGWVVSIERLVVSNKYSKTVSNGIVYGGGISKCLDVLCVLYSKMLGCTYAFCDVPPYRVNSLKEMGFDNNLFATKKSWRSKTPNVEWTGMIANIDEFSLGKTNSYLRYSGYSFFIRNRMGDYSSIGCSTNHPPTRTFIISGDSGLMKNALRNILQKRGYLEMVIDKSNSPVQSSVVPTFISLEWNYGSSKVDPRVSNMKCHIKNVLSDSSAISDKKLLYLNLMKYASINGIAIDFMCNTFPLEEFEFSGDGKVYIVKPVGTGACCGNDINVVSEPYELEKAKRAVGKYSSAIVSEYVLHPDVMPIGTTELTIGHKYHIRMYYLVRSGYSDVVKPGAFLFPIGKVLTAGSVYKPTDFPNKNIHDTHADTTPYNMWYPYVFAGHDDFSFYHKFSEIMTTVSKMFQPHIASYPECDRAYEVFGCDFMVDSNNNAVLLEINSKTGFTTICEPYEKDEPYVELTQLNLSILKYGYKNLLDTKEIIQIPNYKQGILTFGKFSELMYVWIVNTVGL